MPITDRERSEVDAANASGKQPVAFIHGLWLLPNSWDAWRAHFEELGYATLAPGWPDDPDTIEAALANPDAFAGKSIGDICKHLASVVGDLTRKPVLIGHSFGGLLTLKLAGLGYATASVAISPAPFRGVLRLPLSSLKAGFPVLRNPGNKDRAIRLTYEQFRFAFANKVSEDEAHKLYDQYSVPGTGKILFQAAFANVNPGSEASVVSDHPHRGPLLVIAGEDDHTVPSSISHIAYKKAKKNGSPTDFASMTGRGHSLVIDSGWREVADTAVAFLEENGVKP